MVILTTRQTQITSYKMLAHFSISSAKQSLTAAASVYVVIKRSKFQKSPPEFMHTPYRFYISENIKPGQLARNVTIVVKEVNDLSVYDSGFSLDLLNQDLTFADDIFEIVPNYGEGLVVSTLKLKENAQLDYERGKRRYDFVVNNY